MSAMPLEASSKIVRKRASVVRLSTSAWRANSSARTVAMSTGGSTGCVR